MPCGAWATATRDRVDVDDVYLRQHETLPVDHRTRSKSNDHDLKANAGADVVATEREKLKAVSHTVWICLDLFQSCDYREANKREMNG